MEVSIELLIRVHSMLAINQGPNRGASEGQDEEPDRSGDKLLASATSPSLFYSLCSP